MHCSESLELRSTKARKAAALAAARQRQQQEQEHRFMESQMQEDLDEIKSLISDFELDPDPFEDRTGQPGGIGNDLEMHGPPGHDVSRELYCQ